MKATHHQGKAFTLIELLVVISILSLLISILLPALSAARERGRAIQCMNNGRQMGIGFYTYMTDSNDYLPDGSTAGAPGYWRWTTVLVKKYGLSGSLFICPSRTQYAPWASGTVYGWMTASTRANAENIWQRPSYGFNSSHLSQINVAEVTRPSKTVLLAESNWLTDAMPSMHVSGSAGGHMVNPIHAEGWTANILRVDGHVTEMRAGAQGVAGRATYYTADRLGNRWGQDNCWTPTGNP